ncbi:hypothetical protein [Arthrobacter sp. PM3]|uniref:hypothetical protein n=1 Tax=Arthrobacter sp. PM3 TaxID=2017685 RepID=UPI000E10775D|nr:hypothetical protein [Arthrobacter sp. PM3]AXJ09187.1 hypothetical protein CFN17_05840 [Arthrobacter sp. PM3]
MPISKQSLKDDGFTGFRVLGDLDINRIPQKPGIFAVLRPEGFGPQFLARSTAGVFKKKDPTLRVEALDAEWVDGADVLYVGKAGPGSKGNRGLRRQIQEFVDFGKGKPPGHWDGRLIWQLAAARTLIIAWKELPVDQLNGAEAAYHAAFVDEYGRLPYANLVQARAKGKKPGAA